jgi:hypothetical protein
MTMADDSKYSNFAERDLLASVLGDTELVLSLAS